MKEENGSRFFKIIQWLFCLGPETISIEDPAKRLMLSMNVTSKCRFNASMRLKQHSDISFFTTTCLSLGLILIPLLLNSDIKLYYNVQVLNMMQIFMAVAVLVYSIINSKAGYDVRAEKLNLCGDKIKELYREIDHNISNNIKVNYEECLDKYNEISRDSENHNRLDYLLTKLQMKRYYNITGAKLWSLFAVYRASQLISLSIPIAMMLFELMFISDMIGITRIMSPYFEKQNIQN